MNDMTETHAPTEVAVLSHNLSGQRLGRKGRDTRARILAAMRQLLAQRGDLRQLSLSAVAQEAAVGLTTLYLYFADMGELLLAMLEAVTEDQHTLLARFEGVWPDSGLEEACRRFLRKHHAFWVRHATSLHFRNSFADSGDPRLVAERRAMSDPMIALIARQMRVDGDGYGDGHAGLACAVVVLTVIERIAAIMTHNNYRMAGDIVAGTPVGGLADDMMQAQIRIMSLSIADQRAGGRSAR